MDGFRIRRRGEESVVPDVAALLALARSGRLAEDDEVRTARGWVKASALPELRGHLGIAADPWAAWSNVDDHDAATLYRRMVERDPGVPDVEELPEEAVGPVVERVVIVARGPAELPAAALTPLEEPAPTPVVAPPYAARPVRAPTPLPPRAATPRADLPPDGGEVIDFPGPPPLPDFAERARRPSGQPVGVRLSRLLAIGLFCGLGLLLAWPMLRAGGARSTPETTGAATSASPDPSPAEAMLSLDRELRSQLSPTPRVFRSEAEAADTFMVELVQFGVDVRGVDVQVTRWVGRKRDEPKTLEVRVKFAKSADLGRDIGAIALVVGRYKQQFKLDLPVFEVIDADTGGRTIIDGDKAEQYYQNRLPLGRFLAELSG